MLDADTQDILGFSGVELIINCLAECEGTLDKTIRDSLFTQIKPWLMSLLNGEMKTYLPMVGYLTHVFSQHPALVRKIALPWEIYSKELANPTSGTKYTVYLVAWAKSLENNHGFLQFCLNLLNSHKDYYSHQLHAIWDAILIYTRIHSNPSVAEQLITVLEKKELGNLHDVVFEALCSFKNLTVEIVQALLHSFKAFTHIDGYDSEYDYQYSSYRRRTKLLDNLSKISDEIIEALFSAIKNENINICNAALVILSNIPNPASSVVSALLAMPKLEKTSIYDDGYDSDYIYESEGEYVEVSEEVINALSKIAIASVEMTQALIITMDDSDDATYEAIVKVLGNISKPSVEVIKVLVSVVRNVNSRACNIAIKALSSISNPPIEFISALLAISEKKVKKYWYGIEDEVERIEANENVVEAIRKISNPSIEVIEYLITNMNKKAERICEAIVSVLANISNPPPKVIQALLAMAKSNNSEIHRTIRTTLIKMRNFSPEFMYALLNVSLEEHRQSFPYIAYLKVRKDIIEFLIKISNSSSDVTKVLMLATEHKENSHIRQAAVEVLGNIPNPSNRITKSLFNRLKDESYHVHQAAVIGLINNSSISSDQLVKVLISDTFLEEEYGGWNRVIRAIKILSNFSFSEEIIQVFRNALEGKNRIIRNVAIETLGRFSNLPDNLKKILIKLFKTPGQSKHVLKLILDVFIKITSASGEILKTLIELFKSSNQSENVHEIILHIFGKITNPSEELEQIFKGAFKIRRLREKMFTVIGSSQKLLKKYLLLFVEELEEEYESECEKRKIISRLKEIPYPTVDIMRSLLSKIRRAPYIYDPRWEIRRKEYTVAYDFLNKILLPPSKEIIELIFPFTKDNDKYVRLIVIKILRKVPSFDQKLMQIFLTALNDTEWEIQQEVTNILSNIPSPSIEVIKALDSFIRVKQAYQEKIIKNCGENTNPSKEVIQLFFSALKGSKYARRNAEWSIEKLSNIPNESMPMLFHALQEENLWVRRAAVKCLGKISKPSPDVIQKLLYIVQNEESDVGYTAVKALVKISEHFDEIIKTKPTRDIISQLPYIKIFLHCRIRGLIYLQQSEELIFALPQKYITFNCNRDDYQKLLIYISGTRQKLKLPKCILFPHKKEINSLQQESFITNLHDKSLNLLSTGIHNPVELVPLIRRYPRITEISFLQMSSTVCSSHKLTTSLITAMTKLSNTAFAIGGADGIVQIWQMDNLQSCEHVLSKKNNYAITALCSIPGYQENLCSASSDGAIRLWNIKSKSCITCYCGYQNICCLLAYDEELLFSGDQDGNIFLLERDEENKFKVTHVSTENSPIIALMKLANGIISVTVTGQIKIWYIARRIMLRSQWVIEGSQLHQCLPLPSGGFITLNNTGTIQVWDVHKKCLKNCQVPNIGKTLKLTTIDDNTTFASIHAGGTILLWNADQPQPIAQWKLRISLENTFELLVDPIKRVLFFGNKDGSLIRVNIPKIQKLKLHCRRFLQRLDDCSITLEKHNKLVMTFSHQQRCTVDIYKEQLDKCVTLIKKIFIIDTIEGHITAMDSSYLHFTMTGNRIDLKVVRDFLLALSTPLFHKSLLWSRTPTSHSLQVNTGEQTKVREQQEAGGILSRFF